jgi:predicted kinase
MECAILVGLPGAGKTSFYQQHLSTTHRHVSKDAMPNVRNRSARQLRLIDEALRAGQSVALDNTNPRPEDRAPVIDLARRRGAGVIGYFFDADVADCLRRNRLRAARQRVPDVAIFSTAKKLVPPSQAERFDRVYTVRIRKGGEFEVAET